MMAIFLGCLGSVIASREVMTFLPVETARPAIAPPAHPPR